MPGPEAESWTLPGDDQVGRYATARSRTRWASNRSASTSCSSIGHILLSLPDIEVTVQTSAM